jgi:hypothetical protein
MNTHTHTHTCLVVSQRGQSHEQAPGGPKLGLGATAEGAVPPSAGRLELLGGQVCELVHGHGPRVVARVVGVDGGDVVQENGEAVGVSATTTTGGGG